MRPHSNLFPHYPLVHLAVAFSAGIYCPLRFSVAIGLLCTALTLLLFIKQRLQLAALTLLSAMFFTGAVLANLEQRADESSTLETLIEQSESDSFTLTAWLD